MKPFRSILSESIGKTRVVLFGRMNPPTSGHEQNVMAAHKLAQQHNADLHIVASHSHDEKKNPLSPEQKTKHLNRAFGHLKNTTIGSSSKEAPNVLHQAVEAHKAGVKHFILAGGGDRAAGMHKLLHQYNGVEGKSHGYYKFDKITVHNTGERQEGISGTDMRKHAAAGNYAEFKKHLPSHIASNEHHSQELYNDVRHGMGVHKEEFNRESYIAGEVFKLGDLAEDTFTGLTGRVVYRGPTYITLQIDEEVSFKRWIDDVDALQPVEITAKESTMEEFKKFVIAEAEKEAAKDDLDDADIKAIEKQIDALQWDDVKHLLDQDGDGNPDDIKEDVLDEHLSAAERMKKKMEFMKSKAKREIGREIAMKRLSSQDKLKKKAISHARVMIMARLLRGRKKSQLSAAEKDRIEAQIHKNKASLLRISNRLLPKLRSLEQARLKHVHEGADLSAQNVHPTAPNDQVAQNVPDTIHPNIAGTKAQLSGDTEHIDPRVLVNPDKHMRKIKNFRKMEV